jgi:hypothetical protein
MTDNPLLDLLFRNKPEDTYIELQAHHVETGRITQQFVTTLKAAYAFIQQHRDTSHVYFGVCPRVRERGQAQDVACVPALWADIDHEVAFDPNILPLPTVVVKSGQEGHRHLYWVFRTPVPPDAFIKSALAGVHVTLGADATHDLSRRLRVPGTLNWKTKPPSLCTVSSIVPNKLYVPSDFADVARAGLSLTKEVISVGPPAPVDVERLNISRYIYDLITRGVNSERTDRFKREDGTIDRSRMDMAIASALYKAGLTPEQIHGVFANYPCSGRYHDIRHKQAYIEHTISAARDALKRTLITVDFAPKKLVEPAPRRDLVPLPGRGWLHDYAQHLDGRTEAPLSFHLHAGLCVLSAAVGTSLTLPPDTFALYPNVYVLLVGESGITGKSTAIAIARETLTQLIADYPIYGDFTTEALARVLAEQPALLVCRGELGAFTASTAKKYSMDIMPVLAELYDGELTGRLRVTTLSTKWKKPSVTALLGTTGAWLRKYLGMEIHEAIGGGFFPRFFIVSEQDTGKAVPLAPQFKVTPTELANALRPALKDLIRADEQVPSTLSKSAARLYADWYRERRAEDILVEEFRASFFARLRTSAIKVALLTQLTYDGSVTISKEAMQYAIDLCDWHQRNLDSFLDTINPLEKTVLSVADVIKVQGVATRTQIYRMLPGKRPYEIREILQLLVERGDVEEVEITDRKGRGRRPVIGYKWTGDEGRFRQKSIRGENSI